MMVARFDPFFAAQLASTLACWAWVQLVRTKYGDRSVTIDVPETITTVAVLLSLTNGAIASTFGVSPPPRMATLSETIISWVIRFELSGTLASSLTISSILRPATMSPCRAI